MNQKKEYYNLRVTNLLSSPKVIGSKYGTNTFVFRATHLWNQVPDSIKNEPNAKCFKVKLTRNWQVIKCTCTSCKWVEIIEVTINPLPCNVCLLYRNQLTDLHPNQFDLFLCVGQDYNTFLHDFVILFFVDLD